MPNARHERGARDALRVAAGDRGCGNQAERERPRDLPVDVAEGPVRGKGRDREEHDDEQARTDRLTHPEAEHEQIQRDE